jgi:hypothetical protein
MDANNQLNNKPSFHKKDIFARSSEIRSHTLTMRGGGRAAGKRGASGKVQTELLIPVLRIHRKSVFNLMFSQLWPWGQGCLRMISE